MQNLILVLSALVILFLSGCNSSQIDIPTLVPKIPTVTAELLLKTNPTEDFQPSATETMLPEITEVVSVPVCSPLVNYPIKALSGMVSNPFNPPKEGSDDPHQGVDLSVIDDTYRIAIKGEAVQSMIAGNVVMIMEDRFPYGNAILVETSFEHLPVEWQQALTEVPKPEGFGIPPALNCPGGWDMPASETENYSFYVLYAHLDEPAEFQNGDEIICGQELGKIGESGNALAPHLHIEIRYGYADGMSGSMAHYDVSASNEEMANYCRWRVSGFYRLMNPQELLNITPED